MSLQINNLILHFLQRNEQGLTLHPKNELLDVDQVALEFVEALHGIYNAKPGKSYAFFNEESAFKPKLAEYIAQELDFLDFSRQALESLAEEMGKYDFAESGYLLLVDYEYVGVRYFLVAQLGMEHHFKVNQSLEICADKHLNVQKIQLAARIDMTEMAVNSDSNKYISFIKGRAGRKVADFFLDFLGCDEGVVAKEKTQELVQAVEAFMATEGLEGDEMQAARKSLVEYCQSTKEEGGEVHIAEVAETMAGHTGGSFADFYQQQGYGEEESFPVEAAVVNKMVKFSGYGGGITVGFERKHLGDSVVYDHIADTLLIRKVPPNLKDQLLKALQSGSGE